MAYVQVIYRWPEGNQLVATVRAKDGYPDAVNQARSECVRAFKEAWAALEGEDVEMPTLSSDGVDEIG